LNATAPPAWQTFHNLTTTKPEADVRDFTAPQTTTDLPHTTELQDNSDESDFDPEVSAPTDLSAEIDDILPELLDSDSDEEHVIPAAIDPPTPTRRSIRVRQAPVSFKAKRQDRLLTNGTTTMIVSAQRAIPSSTPKYASTFPDTASTQA